MSVIKELDPELHLKMIEGYTDELTTAARADDLFYAMHRKCKRCGHELIKEFASNRWSSESIVAKAILRCQNCDFCIEPFTGVILDSGKASKIPDPTMPAYKVDFER